MHDRVYGCDDCQDACPVSVRLGRRNTIDIGPGAEAWVDAVELLQRDDEWILDRYGRWYIAGRDVTWLRRNALVIAGNVGDPSDPRLVAVVERYRTGSDPILAEHAAWARARLDERQLEPATP
jgi:epoxyqueuosine reductase